MIISGRALPGSQESRITVVQEKGFGDARRGLTNTTKGRPMANSETLALISGEKTVTATGTAEALVSASQRAKAVTIIAKTGNTGQV